MFFYFDNNGITGLDRDSCVAFYCFSGAVDNCPDLFAMVMGLKRKFLMGVDNNSFNFIARCVGAG